MIAYGLLRERDNHLMVDTFRVNREEVIKMLTAEFPKGHVIYPGHRVVKVRMEIVE